MSMEDNLLYVKQALLNRGHNARVRPDRVDVVRSTLRLAGFRQEDGTWFLPEGHDTRSYPIMWQKKSGAWMFNIWYYKNWQRWMQEENLYERKVHDTRFHRPYVQ